MPCARNFKMFKSNFKRKCVVCSQAYELRNFAEASKYELARLAPKAREPLRGPGACSPGKF